MSLRLFVTSAGALILAWLALTFFRGVPMEGYSPSSPAAEGINMQETRRSLAAKELPIRADTKLGSTGK